MSIVAQNPPDCNKVFLIRTEVSKRYFKQEGAALIVAKKDAVWYHGANKRCYFSTLELKTI